MTRAVICAAFVVLSPLNDVSFRASRFASKPIISCSTMLGSSEEAAWLSITRARLYEKPDVVSCLAADIEQLLRGDRQGAGAYGETPFITVDGEITLPPVEDESAAAEPALVDALSWSALEFALDGSLRSCRLWQTSPHRARLEVLEAGFALQANDDPGEAASCGRLLAMALGLAEMEMALQGLSTSHHTEAPGEGAGVASSSGGGGRMLLKDLLVHPNVQARLPRGLQCVLRYLFLPCGLNLRNLVWHGFVDPPQLHPRHAALLLLLLLNIHTPGRRVVSPPDRAWRSQSHPKLGAHVASLYQHVIQEEMRPTIHSLVRTSGFILPGAEALVCASWEWYAAGRPLAGALGLILVLEQSLRRAFALCNNRPRHFFARSKEYYATLDGFGQRDRHQLLLAARLVAEAGDERQPTDNGRTVPTGDMGTQAASMDNEEEDEATAGRAEEGRDRVYVDGKGGVENLLLVELGVGHVSCLLDLFLLDHGPGLRSKLAHGGVDALSLLCPHDSCHASRLLLLLFLSLATHYHPSSASSAADPPLQASPPSSDGPSGWAHPHLASCHGLVHGAYRSGHHPRALLSSSLRSAVEPLHALSTLLHQRSWVIEDSGQGKDCTLLLTLPSTPPRPTSTEQGEEVEARLDSMSLDVSPAVLRLADRRDRLGVWVGQEDAIANVANATYAWARPIADALHSPASTPSVTRHLLDSIVPASTGEMCDTVEPCSGYLDRMWPSQQVPTPSPPPPPSPLLTEDPPHLRLSNLSDVLCPAPPLHACALQITAAVGSTACAFAARLACLESLVFHRHASSSQRRLYVQTLYILPAAYLYLSACLLAVDYHVMAAMEHEQGEGQPLKGKRLMGRRALPALLNELLSFRRCVLWSAAETGQHDTPSPPTPTSTVREDSPPSSSREADIPAPPDVPAPTPQQAQSHPPPPSPTAPPPSSDVQGHKCSAPPVPQSTAPRQRKTYGEAFAGVGQLLARLQAHEDGLKPRKKKWWM